MGFSVALITVVCDVSQILMNLSYNPVRNPIILSSLCSWRKKNKDHGNHLRPQREVRSRDEFRVACPRTPKASPHLARLHHLAGRGAKDLQTPLIAVTAACAQHPPRAGKRSCGQSREHTAQLSATAHLWVPHLKASVWLQLSYFVVLDGITVQNYWEKNWES